MTKRSRCNDPGRLFGSLSSIPPISIGLDKAWESWPSARSPDLGRCCAACVSCTRTNRQARSPSQGAAVIIVSEGEGGCLLGSHDVAARQAKCEAVQEMRRRSASLRRIRGSRPLAAPEQATCNQPPLLSCLTTTAAARGVFLRRVDGAPPFWTSRQKSAKPSGVHTSQRNRPGPRSVVLSDIC